MVHAFYVRSRQRFWSVRHGSGLQINSDVSNYVVHDSVVAYNGQSPSDGDSWADGITVFGCDNSIIRDSTFAENTDVSLGVNGSSSCSVYRNHVSNSEKFAFAGLVIGDPCCSGGDYSDNDVAAGEDLMGWGILVGPSPWDHGDSIVAGGVQVYNNSSDGSVVTLAVDGLSGGDVYSNSYSNNRGSHIGSGCGSSAAYTVGNLYNSASVQGGYSTRTYSSCTPAY